MIRDQGKSLRWNTWKVMEGQQPLDTEKRSYWTEKTKGFLHVNPRIFLILFFWSNHRRTNNFPHTLLSGHYPFPSKPVTPGKCPLIHTAAFALHSSESSLEASSVHLFWRQAWKGNIKQSAETHSGNILLCWLIGFCKSSTLIKISI